MRVENTSRRLRDTKSGTNKMPRAAAKPPRKDNKMTTIIRVMESIVKMNGWKVERFDIQAYHMAYGINEYVGYLTIEGKGQALRIREDGSFEWCE